MRLAALTALALVAGCTASRPSASTDPPPERAGLVTLLGDDTLAVERFTRTPAGVEATVALRAPETTITEYRLDLADDGALRGYQATTRRPGSDVVVRREVAEPAGDSLRVTVTEGAETRTRTVAGGDRPVPFVDMVHWPYVLVTERALGAGGPAEQPLFTERGALAFTTDVGPGRAVTITHPSRGPMTATANADGQLVALDAGATTRKVAVRRVPDVDVEGFAQRAVAADAAGRPFGALSGRAEASATVGGATVAVDYGQPLRRGREVWGALVPWGEVWRTGANQATHIETDRPLVLGEGNGALAVPAGEYTLYTIPQPDGGVLIVNRQTGQGGTTYDAGRDLGRVPLTRTPLSEAVEAFTVAVEATGPASGRLALRWNRDEFAVPFAVAD